MDRNLLLVRAGDHLCAVPVEHIEETMRPMRLKVLPGLPKFVRGTAIVRGEPTAVVDLRAFFDDRVHPEPRRLVTLRIGAGRRIGMLVDDVLGIQDEQTLAASTLPPLVQQAAHAAVEQLAELDGELLTVLRCSHLIPADALHRLSAPEHDR